MTNEIPKIFLNTADIYIDLQSYIIDLSKENLNETYQYLIKSNFSKTKEGIYILCKELMDAITMRLYNLNIYSSLLIFLSKYNKFLKNSLISIFTSPANSLKIKNIHLKILHKFLFQEIITFKEIYQKIEEFDKENYKKQFFLFFSYFAKELWEQNQTKFMEYLTFISKFEELSKEEANFINKILLSAVSKPIEDSTKWDDYNDILEYGYTKESAEYSILIDNSSTFTPYFIDYSSETTKSTFYVPLFGDEQPSYLQMAVSHSSMVCLNYMLNKLTNVSHLAKLKNYAVASGSFSIVSLLASNYGISFSNCILLAASLRQFKIFDFILKTYYEYKLSAQELAKLMLVCCETNNIETFVYTLKNGCDLNCKDSHQRTPLHLAAMNNNLALVTLLTMFANIDINAVDDQNRTALHYASENKFHELIKFLLNCQGIDTEIKDINNETPVELASK